MQPDGELIAAAPSAGWEELKALVARCRACSMADSRLHTVFSDGGPGCRVVIVGEAPGRDEDIEGVPFVGKSGQLLTVILEHFGLKRGRDVAVVNVLKCRPQGNRDPLPQEVAACSAFLERQLALLEPDLLILMGRHAVQRILRTEAVQLGRLRGSAYGVSVNGRDVPAIVTYHPSYLLRSPVEKQKAWEDMLLAMRTLRAARAGREEPAAPAAAAEQPAPSGPSGHA
ncbi:MAG: uracil-DNA glycosylase [Duodenibacillus sp.]|nr:uracil-DNA glycosylase [Duodenibacillus sp.]